jgi:hypothetical protein
MYCLHEKVKTKIVICILIDCNVAFPLSLKQIFS